MAKYFFNFKKPYLSPIPGNFWCNVFLRSNSKKKSGKSHRRTYRPSSFLRTEIPVVIKKFVLELTSFGQRK